MPHGLPAGENSDPAPQGAPSGVAAPAEPPALAPETARLYHTDWTGFVAWCRARGHTPLPAAPATVAAFLTDAGDTLSAGALGRRAAAIGYQHRLSGLASPTADPTVRTILATARQATVARRAAAPRRQPSVSAARLTRLAAACPGDLAGLRDRALLLLAAAGFLPRAALVGLDVERVRIGPTAIELAVPDADRVTLRRIVVPRGATLATCPVRALEEWLRASGTMFGPVFRKVDRWGNVEHRRLGTDAIRRILARRQRRRRPARKPPP
jgi:hypothetical protein